MWQVEVPAAPFAVDAHVHASAVLCVAWYTICWKTSTFGAFMSFSSLGAFLALAFLGVALPISLALALAKLPLQSLHLFPHAVELPGELAVCLAWWGCASFA